MAAKNPRIAVTKAPPDPGSIYAYVIGEIKIKKDNKINLNKCMISITLISKEL